MYINTIAQNKTTENKLKKKKEHRDKTMTLKYAAAKKHV